MTFYRSYKTTPYTLFKIVYKFSITVFRIKGCVHILEELMLLNICALNEGLVKYLKQRETLVIQ